MRGAVLPWLLRYWLPLRWRSRWGPSCGLERAVGDDDEPIDWWCVGWCVGVVTSLTVSMAVALADLDLGGRGR